MLSYNKKISFLKESLEHDNGNYAESFKADILIFIDNFNSDNSLLIFLNNLSSFDEISDWINKLISRIVLKFDEESESINDFIYDYIVLG
jgi:hypothetical protein